MGECEKVMYFIGDKLASVEPTGLKPGIRIFCFKYNKFWVTFKDFEGPYNTLQELTKNSVLYKELQRTNAARAQQVISKKYIINCNLEKRITVNHNTKKPKDFIQTMQHVTKGIIKSNQIYGIHFYDKDNMQIIQKVKEEDLNGVWEAEVKVFDKLRNRWFKKQSTFFPTKWNHTQLWHECDYAINNLLPHENSQYKFSSKTFTGIPVEVIIRNDIIISIYPLYIEVK